MIHITVKPVFTFISFRLRALASSLLLFLLFSETALAGGVVVNVEKTGFTSYDLSWTYDAVNASIVKWSESANGGPYVEQYFLPANHSKSFTKSPGTYSYRFYGCNFQPPEYQEICETQNPTTINTTVDTLGPASINIHTTPSTHVFHVTWSGPIGTKNYKWSSKIAGGSWSQETTSTSFYVMQDLPSGTYSYRVRACDEQSVCTPYSPTKTIEVVVTPPVSELEVGFDSTSDNNLFFRAMILTLICDCSANQHIEYRLGSGAWQPYKGPLVLDRTTAVSARVAEVAEPGSTTYGPVGSQTYTRQLAP